MKIFNRIFAQNIECGNTLEPPRRECSNSNVYPLSMFCSKNTKIGIPLHTPVLLFSVVFKGYTLHRHVIMMVLLSA